MNTYRIKPHRQLSEQEPLREESDHSLAEMRMVLPGVQALLGFQTIAVFQQNFDSLSLDLKVCHLVSLLLISLSSLLTISPSAFHRLGAPGVASKRLMQITTILYLFSMISLALGLSLEIYVVFSMVLENRWLTSGIAIGVLAVASMLWFYLPVRCRSMLRQ